MKKKRTTKRNTKRKKTKRVKTRKLRGGLPKFSDIFKTQKEDFLSTQQKKEEDAVIDVDKVSPDPSTPVQINKINLEDVYKEYLADVLFGEEKENEIKDVVMKKSFGSNTYFVDLFEKIMNVLPPKKKGQEWVSCEKDSVKDCFSQTHDNILLEIGTTAYMLRVLTKSVVGDIKNNQIAFVFSLDNKEKITGRWEKDKDYFKMKILIKDKSKKNCKARLIMGFGPSASGKTYCANRVIELMTSIDSEFPKFFMTVDGGVFREESLVYQIITTAIGKKGDYDGLTNLVSAGSSTTKSIFDSKLIKNTMNEYLKEQKEKEKFVVCLYVPETLGGCGSKIICAQYYQEYIDITGDEDWIGLMIFQHVNRKECPYKEKYKCTGTTESGESREKREGKKYSSIAYENSYLNGNEYINRALTYRFRIHNSGSPDGITIFEDLSPNKIDMDDKNVSKFFKESKWQYMSGKVKNSSDCEEYSNKCSKGRKRSDSDSSVE